MIRFAAIVIAFLIAGCSNGRSSAEPGSTDERRPDTIAPQPTESNGVVYEAQAEAGGDSLRVEVTATNTGDASQHLEFGACALSLALYEDGARDDPAAWDEDRLERVCVLYLATRDLAPGESISPREFRHAVAVNEILGDSLEPGWYHLTARLEVNGERHVLPADSVRLEAG